MLVVPPNRQSISLLNLVVVVVEVDVVEVVLVVVVAVVVVVIVVVVVEVVPVEVVVVAVDTVVDVAVEVVGVVVGRVVGVVTAQLANPPPTNSFNIEFICDTLAMQVLAEIVIAAPTQSTVMPSPPGPANSVAMADNALETVAHMETSGPVENTSRTTSTLSMPSCVSHAIVPKLCDSSQCAISAFKASACVLQPVAPAPSSTTMMAVGPLTWQPRPLSNNVVLVDVEVVDVGVVTWHPSNMPATKRLDIWFIIVATASHSLTSTMNPAPRQAAATDTAELGPSDSSIALFSTSTKLVHSAMSGWLDGPTVTKTFSTPRWLPQAT